MSTFDYTGFKLGEKKVLKENEVTHAPAEVPHLLSPINMALRPHLPNTSPALSSTLCRVFLVRTEADPGQAGRGLEAGD
jgi:hypothetical protein